MPSFPSTPTLLDDFNRANEDPISSPWTIVTGTPTANLTLAVGSDAASTRLFDAYPVSEDVPLDYGRKHVLAAGETIQASASVANQLVLTITGEEQEAT